MSNPEDGLVPEAISEPESQTHERPIWPKPLPEVLGFAETSKLALIRVRLVRALLEAGPDQPTAKTDRLGQAYREAAATIISQLPGDERAKAALGLIAAQSEAYREGDWFNRQQVLLDQARQTAQRMGIHSELTEALNQLSRHAILSVIYEISEDLGFVEHVAASSNDDEIWFDVGQIFTILGEVIDIGGYEATMILFEEQFLELLALRNIIEG